MDKKDSKFYVAPASEVVELEVETQLLAGSNPDDPFDGSTEPTPEGPSSILHSDTLWTTRQRKAPYMMPRRM